MKTILFTRLRRRYAVNLHILYRSLLFLILMLYVSYAVEAQSADSGAVKIKVIDKSNYEAIPFANVVAYQNGVQVAVGTTNMEGESVLKNLAPGKYDVKAIYVGYKASEIKGVIIGAGKTAYCNINLDGGDNSIACYEITYCCCLYGYNGYSGENWWPKLWTPYREMYKEWKEKKEKKQALAVKQPKKKKIMLNEEPDETDDIENIAKRDSIESARIVITEEYIFETTKIYPNPASDVLHVESSRPLQNMIILDESGGIIREELMQSSATDINLNGFANGIYYLTYVLDGKSESRKLVIINH